MAPRNLAQVIGRPPGHRPSSKMRWRVGAFRCVHHPPRPTSAVQHLKPHEQKDWHHTPGFLTPFKLYKVLCDQDCTMTCAFLGNLCPMVTFYKSDVNIMANSKLREWCVHPTHAQGQQEHSTLAENELSKDHSSCTLTIYGEGTLGLGWGHTSSLGQRRKITVSWAIRQLSSFEWYHLSFHLTTTK